MKKYFTITIMCVLASALTAQEAAEKKVQAGLITSFGINMQKMGTKLMESNGVGSDLTIGANVNFSFNETIGLCTGVEFDFESLKYRASSTPVYYHYVDNTILTNGESGNANAQLYQLSTRSQKPVYLTVPAMMLFRTKFIGYFRYFGKFGLRTSFLLKSKINDTGVNYDPDNVFGIQTAGNNENMTAKNEMFFFKSAVGLAGGAEWNFTGSTCLVAELGFYYGFTPLHVDRKEDKTYLYTSALNNGSGNDVKFSNKSTQTQLMLKFSILF